MKRRFLTPIAILAMILLTLSVQAQIEQPVHWAYGTKKLSGGIVELHLLATIDAGWHIYAQKQSADAVAVPTHIKIPKQDGVTVIGVPVEIGKKEAYTVKEVGITNQEYAGKVDFVQKVKLKPGLRAVKAVISYQACTHERCLPEDKVELSIPIP